MNKKTDEIKTELKKHYKASDDVINVFLAGVFSRSRILLFGGHGKAKSTLASTISTITGTSFSRVQGTVGLTENKFIARYNIPELMKGNEKVEWRNFITSRIKMIDEINRCHSTTLNAFFSMMAEGVVTYGDQQVDIPDSIFIATMNPADAGTFDIPAPLVDRFDIAIPLKSATIFDKMNIFELQDLETKQIIDENELKTIWSEVNGIDVPKESKLLAISFIRDMQLCTHGDKEFLTAFPQCCEKCRFNEHICSKLDNKHSISERAYLSTVQIAKGLAYINGEKTVTPEDIKTAMRFTIMHRVKMLPVHAQKYESKDKVIDYIINSLIRKHMERAQPYRLIDQIGKGKDKMKDLEKWALNDMLINEIYQNMLTREKEKYTSNLDDLKKLSGVELEDFIVKNPTAVKPIKDELDKHLIKFKTYVVELTGEQLVSFTARVAPVDKPFAKSLQDKLVSGNMETKSNMHTINVTYKTEKTAKGNLLMTLTTDSIARMEAIKKIFEVI